MPRTSSQIAWRACGSSPVVSSSRNTTSGSLMSASAINSRCFWPPERFMNQALRLSVRPSCSSSRSPSSGFLPIERSPQVDRLPHLDALLQLRLLQLHADAVLQFVDVAEGVEPQNRDGAAIGLAQSLNALHCGGFSGAVWPDQAEDLTLVYFKRGLGYSDRPAVAFADTGYLDDRAHLVCGESPGLMRSLYQCPSARRVHFPLEAAINKRHVSHCECHAEEPPRQTDGQRVRAADRTIKRNVVGRARRCRQQRRIERPARPGQHEEQIQRTKQGMPSVAGAVARPDQNQRQRSHHAHRNDVGEWVMVVIVQPCGPYRDGRNQAHDCERQQRKP